MSAKTKTEQIECEEVIVKIPKLIMRFLREHQDILGEKTGEYLQRNIVGLVRANTQPCCLKQSFTKLIRRL